MMWTDRLDMKEFKLSLEVGNHSDPHQVHLIICAWSERRARYYASKSKMIQPQGDIWLNGKSNCSVFKRHSSAPAGVISVGRS